MQGNRKTRRKEQGNMNNPDVLVCYVDSAVYKVIKEAVKSCFFDAENWIRILCKPIPPDEDDPDLTKYLKFSVCWLEPSEFLCDSSES
jgi:hypothetical protein